MKTFKNKNFVKRDYKSSQAVFCQSEKAPNDNYVEVNEIELDMSGCEQLYKQRYIEGGILKDVIYYGHM